MESSLRREHAFAYRTAVAGPHEIGEGPYGMRHYYDITDGVVDGPCLSGKTIGAGVRLVAGLLRRVFRIDARIQIATYDGALLCAHYRAPV